MRDTRDEQRNWCHQPPSAAFHWWIVVKSTDNNSSLKNLLLDSRIQASRKILSSLQETKVTAHTNVKQMSSLQETNVVRTYGCETGVSRIQARNKILPSLRDKLLC
jgi:hypothetical protein